MVEKDVFDNIKNEFSSVDIRDNYKFENVLGGGHFGTVRMAGPKHDLNCKVAVKSILKA
jgi:calcium-dependent protein kinase